MADRLDKRQGISRLSPLVRITAVVVILLGATPSWTEDAPPRITPQPLRVVLVLDRSGSMDVEDRRQRLIDSVAAMMVSLPRSSELGVVVFNHQAEQVLPLTRLDESCLDELVAVIEAKLTPQGGTDILGGVDQALDMFGTAGGRIVLLSDGYQSGIGTEPAPESMWGGPARMLAQRARQQQIVLHAVGLGPEVQADPLLQLLAAETGGSFHPVREARDLLAEYIGLACRLGKYWRCSQASQFTVAGPVEVIQVVPANAPHQLFREAGRQWVPVDPSLSIQRGAMRAERLPLSPGRYAFRPDGEGPSELLRPLDVVPVLGTAVLPAARDTQLGIKLVAVDPQTDRLPDLSMTVYLRYGQENSFSKLLLPRTKHGWHAAPRVEAAQRQAVEQLRPDERYLLPAAIGKFSNVQTLAALEQNRQRWIRLGKPELVKKSIAVGRQLQQLGEARAVAYLESVAKHVLHAGELTAAVRETVHRLEERRSAIQRELEMLAATDHNGRLREIINRLEHASWPVWRQRPRQDARTVLERTLEADAREQALRVFGGYLDRQIELLNGKLQLAEQAEQGLALARKQVEAQLSELSEAIGMGNGYYEEILTPEDLPAVTAKLRQEISSTIGTPGGLDLGGVLQACNKDGLPELLEEFAERTAQQVREFLRQRTPDLVSFVEHFKLDFDVAGWLQDALQVPLPAKLDLSAIGPGNSPLRVYVSGAPSLEQPLMATVWEAGDTLNAEYCPADDPYQLTVLAKISRAPFCSIPGLVEMERAFEQFRKTAPKDHVWGILHSHGTLEGACEVSLLERRPDTRRSGSRNAATAPLPR